MYIVNLKYSAIRFPSVLYTFPNFMRVLQKGAPLDGTAAVFRAQRVHGFVQLLRFGFPFVRRVEQGGLDVVFLCEVCKGDAQQAQRRLAVPQF